MILGAFSCLEIGSDICILQSMAYLVEQFDRLLLRYDHDDVDDEETGHSFATLLYSIEISWHLE